MVTKRSKTVAVKFLVIYIFLLRYFWSKTAIFGKFTFTHILGSKKAKISSLVNLCYFY